MGKNISKRYSQKDLDYFKKIILDKIESAEKDLLLLKESFDNRKLYEYLLFSDDYDSPSTHKKLINSFIIN